MEQTTVRAHTGWREDEIDQLWRQIQEANQQGQPLRAVFERMGEELGRKPNSVRNYYYMQLRPRDGRAMRRAAPFETFTEEEVRKLVRDVLTARAQGQSVRAAVTALSGGDHTRMLRYQNKYRSVLKKRPQLIRDTAETLRREGIDCPEIGPVHPAPGPEDQLARKLDALGDERLQPLLPALNALADRALDGDRQTGRDRMRVRLDMAQLKYEDLCRRTGDMLLLCKEYLGQEEEMRAALQPAFLETLRQRVADVENAMQ